MKYNVILETNPDKIEMKNVSYETNDYDYLSDYLYEQLPRCTGWSAYGVYQDDNITLVVYELLDDEQNVIGFLLEDTESDDE